MTTLDTRAPTIERRQLLPGPRKTHLTAREVQLLELVALGHSNDDIGKEMKISVYTVKTSLQRMFNFCNVKNRAALVTYGFSYGLLDPNELHSRWQQQGERRAEAPG